MHHNFWFAFRENAYLNLNQRASVEHQDQNTSMFLFFANQKKWKAFTHTFQDDMLAKDKMSKNTVDWEMQLKRIPGPE